MKRRFTQLRKEIVSGIVTLARQILFWGIALMLSSYFGSSAMIGGLKIIAKNVQNGVVAAARHVADSVDEPTVPTTTYTKKGT